MESEWSCVRKMVTRNFIIHLFINPSPIYRGIKKIVRVVINQKRANYYSQSRCWWSSQRDLGINGWFTTKWSSFSGIQIEKGRFSKTPTCCGSGNSFQSGSVAIEKKPGEGWDESEEGIHFSLKKIQIYLYEIFMSLPLPFHLSSYDYLVWEELTAFGKLLKSQRGWQDAVE